MPIKEGYVSEKQAHEIACTHNNRKVCIKTVTNLRSALGAQKTSTGKWIYQKSACEKKWPRGKYRTEKRSESHNDNHCSFSDFHISIKEKDIPEFLHSISSNIGCQSSLILKIANAMIDQSRIKEDRTLEVFADCLIGYCGRLEEVCEKIDESITFDIIEK